MPCRSWPSRFIRLVGVLALLLFVLTLAPTFAFAQTTHVSRSQARLLSTHFVWTATSANTEYNATYIDNPATNFQTGLALFVTPNWNPRGACGCQSIPSTYNAVLYDTTSTSHPGQWAIFDNGGRPIQPGTSFNVLAVPLGGSVFWQTSNASNIVGDSTYLDNPLTNNHPEAQLLVMRGFSTALDPLATIDPVTVGVWYDDVVKEWAIFNEDRTSMISHADFFVMVGASASGGGTEFSWTATTSTTGGDSTFLDTSVTNEHPNAIVFATQNWSPGGIGSFVYNNATLGVWYQSSSLFPHPQKWAVFNEDASNLPLGTGFNVLTFSS